MGEQKYTARRYSKETKLDDDKLIIIAAPSGENGRAGAERLLKVLEGRGSHAEILDDPSSDVMYKADGPVFLLGNLANNKCVKELYFRFLCVTDRWYPGNGGYEVRTLLDPFGIGHNIIHIGYSDDTGLSKALETLIKEVKNPLPYMSIVHAVRLPIPENEVYNIRNKPLAEYDWQLVRGFDVSAKGYMGYLTGDQNLLDEYYAGWERMLAAYDIDDPTFYALHLFALSHISTWRLLEQAGMIPEKLQAPIIEFFYDWAVSKEGLGHLENPIYQSPNYPRQNHGLVPAIALIYAYDYFKTHFSSTPELEKWKQTADAVFAPYFDGSWKPVCDGLNHGWWLAQPAMLQYGLVDPEHKYFISGGAKKAADCAMAIVNNQGWMPNAGDSDILRAFPGDVLKIAAAFYNDPEYCYVHSMAPEYLRNCLVICPNRTFDIGLKPVQPTKKTGMTVVEMDSLVYDAWRLEPDIAPEFLVTGPSAPIEKCFDKLAVRSGWNDNDDYLLIDGLGTCSASHSYSDAMGILDYSRFGLSFIVSEDNLLWPEPESHSLLTLTCDAERGPIPSFAELEEKSTDEKGNNYIRMKLSNYEGTDWIREVFFRKNSCVVFRDTIIAGKAGSYAADVHFRIPGSCVRDRNTVVRLREDKDKNSIEFRLTSLCSENAELSISEVPVKLLYRCAPGEEEPLYPESSLEEAWKRRYKTDRIELSAFKTHIATQFEPGDIITFTHMAQPVGKGESVVSLDDQGDSIVLRDTKGEIRLPVLYKSSRINKVKERKESECRELCSQVIAKFDMPAVSLEPLGNNKIACGLAGGLLIVMNTNGELENKVQLEGEIHKIASVKPDGSILAVGHGDSSITVLAVSGEILWKHNIVRDPSPYPWWELNKPSVVEIKAGIFEGETLIAVGCGDTRVRLYELDGSLRWIWPYDGFIPARILIEDVVGNGTPELIIGGDLLSSAAMCAIITHKQQLVGRLCVEGWTSRVTSVVFSREDNRVLIACGSNRGRNLQLFDLSTLNPKFAQLSDSDIYGSGGSNKYKLFDANLGGEVTGIGLFPAKELLIAVTTEGFITAYNFDGKKVWFRMHNGGIRYLIAKDNKIIVSDTTGTCHIYSVEGKHLAQSAQGLPWHSFCNLSQEVYFTSGNMLLRLNNSF